MAAAVPGVEVADDGHTAGVRRPDGEAHAFDLADSHRVRAEEGVGPQVRAFAEEMQVVVVDQRAEGIGVGIDAVVAIGPLHGQAVVEVRLAARNGAFPQAGGVALRKLGGALAGGGIDDGDARCTGQHRAHHSLPSASACRPSTANGSPWRASINACACSESSTSNRLHQCCGGRREVWNTRITSTASPRTLYGTMIARVQDHEFARVKNPPRSTEARLLGQHRHGFKHMLDDHACCSGIVLGDEGSFGIEIAQRGAQPLNAHAPSTSCSRRPLPRRSRNRPRWLL